MRKTHKQRRLDTANTPLRRWPRKAKRGTKRAYCALLIACANEKARERGLPSMSAPVARRGLRAFFGRTRETLTIRDNMHGTSITFHLRRGQG